MPTQLLNVCLDKNKKNIMIKSLDCRIDHIITVLGSQKVLEEVKLIKKEIENTTTC